jgi:D-alanyl-D-alanine carboxypeptidase
LFGLLVALAASTGASVAQSAPQLDPAASASVDAAVRKTLSAGHVVGATVIVVRNGAVVYTGEYGLRDVAAGLPSTATTKYEVGSVTKQFTAAAILQLREAGKIDLDAPLATYLPSVPHAKDVTIRQLLALTSGLPEYTGGVTFATAVQTPATFDGLMASIAGKPLDFKPGTNFGASNTNYLVLGRLVELVSGQHWSDYAAQHLFGAAGMAESSTISFGPHLTEMARGYTYTFADEKVTPSLPLDASWATGTADIVTTAGDLVKWDAALASGKIVSPQDYELMTTSGFGFSIDTFGWQPRIMSQGDTFGFDASDSLFPAQGVRIIVLTNTENPDRGGSGSMETADAIYHALYPVVSATPRPASTPPVSQAQALYSAAIAAMDRSPQPAFITYTLQGESEGIHLGLLVIRHQVWLNFGSAMGSTTWNVKHRTEDYESEVVDGDTGKRYVSSRAIFDPTWFGAYRALRDGMLGYQNAQAPRTSLTVSPPTPAPDSTLNTIATVNVIGPSIYGVTDRGPATCSNGDPGQALHLRPHRRDSRHQLSDVVVDLRSMRFCTIRFGWSEMWFSGFVEQHYANVGGYWVVTDGSIDGTLRAFGIATHHFVWTYRLVDTTYPAQIPAATFVPDATQ